MIFFDYVVIVIITHVALRVYRKREIESLVENNGEILIDEYSVRSDFFLVSNMSIYSSSSSRENIVQTLDGKSVNVDEIIINSPVFKDVSIVREVKRLGENNKIRIHRIAYLSLKYKEKNKKSIN